MSLLQWLGLAEQDNGPTVDSLAEIQKSLHDLEPERGRFLACFAYILSRVARADQQVSEDESALMVNLVAESGGIPPEQARLVVRIATAEAWRHGGTEDYIVSRTFAALATVEQKRALLACLFAVSAVDDAIHTIEDNAIRQIVSEIRLEHADFIAARARYRGNFAVLKPRDA